MREVQDPEHVIVTCMGAECDWAGRGVAIEVGNEGTNDPRGVGTPAWDDWQLGQMPRRAREAPGALDH